MKKYVKIWALVLACVFLMTIPAMAAQQDDPVLFTFEGQEIHESEVLQRAAAYAQSQYISSDVAYQEAIDYMIVNQLVAEAKAAELGLDQYTDAEMAALKEEAAEYFEQQLDAVTEYFGSQLNDADKAAFREELRASWAEIGTDLESAEETHIFNATRQRLLETMEVEITEDEIQAVFEQQVQKDENFFSNDIRAYEYYVYYQGADIWYVPEGYRGINQILLTVDQELTDAYAAAVKAEEGVEEAAAAILAAEQETIDEIYARLDAGEDFTTLMQEYSEDPSLTDELAENGYAVHRESTVWNEEFVAGAFSDQMQQIGDVSDPIASKYGVQILNYHRDVPAGGAEMNDRIRESITTYLTNQKRVAMLESWVEDYEISYNQEAINALIAKSAALAAEAAE